MTRPKQTPSRGKTRVSPPKKRGAKAKLLLSAAFLLLMALLIAVMALSARVVHVRHTDVYLQDLPAGFDGITILYVSDIDLLSESTFRATRRLFQRMQALKPDVLLLGGDYTSETLLSILNRQGDVSAENSNREIALRNEFFRALETFSAPMGKYAVRAQADPSVDVLEAAMAASQITLLQDEAIPLYSGAERIYLVGLAPFAEDSAALSGMSGQFSAVDCVVVAAHSAGSFSAIQIAEASDGGTWADLVLCGHSHGGQIRFGDRTLVQLTNRERQYLAGWYVENGVKLLVSQGLGCEGVALRLGSAPEANLLTLRKGEPPLSAENVSRETFSFWTQQP